MRTKGIIKQLCSEIRPRSHFDNTTRNMANQGEENSDPVAPANTAEIIRETVRQLRQPTIEEVIEKN